MWTQKLLEIATWERRKFFKKWNALESEGFYFSSPVKKMAHLLERWPETKPFRLDRRFDFVGALDPQYPVILWQLPQPPVGLFLWGNANLLREQTLSVIGSRKPTSYSLRMTRRCLRQWCQEKKCIVSGGAYGIDGEAHWAALENSARTIAILGSGFQHFYPAKHEKLFHRMIEEGSLLVSEYPPFETPRSYYFPERNRLIAALGNQLFLAQAHEKSGSLSTAMTALELGREIFVLKPPPADENFFGSQKLIEAGAKEIIQAKDLYSDEPSAASPFKY